MMQAHPTRSVNNYSIFKQHFRFVVIYTNQNRKDGTVTMRFWFQLARDT